MPPASPSSVAATILAQRAAFKAFVAARTGRADDAEDILQDSLVKALQRAGDLQDEASAIAWFYRILRRTLIDHARRRSASRRRDDAWVSDPAAPAADHEARRQICACFESLLPALKPAHTELIRRVDLQGESVSAVAQSLGVTPNHASVALHRARAALRKQLQAFCGPCADGACLDCDCEPRKL